MTTTVVVVTLDKVRLAVLSLGWDLHTFLPTELACYYDFNVQIASTGLKRRITKLRKRDWQRDADKQIAQAAEYVS